MRIRVLFVTAFLVSLLLAGCQTTSVGYKCNATIEPAKKEQDAFEAQIELIQIRGQSEKCLFAPKVTCRYGETAEFMVANGEQHENGFFAKFFIPELDTGGTAHCSIHLKEKGQTKFLSDLRLTLPANSHLTAD